MTARRTGAQVSALENALWRQGAAVERIKLRAEEIAVACEDIQIDEGDDYFKLSSIQREGSRKLRDVGFRLLNIVEELEALAWIANEVENDLQELVPKPKPRPTYRPPDAWLT